MSITTVVKYLSLVACAVSLVGCGSNYKDPEDFMEGPGREALKGYYKDVMAENGFEDFEFSNVKLELDRGGNEWVTANFSMKPGDDYYQLVYEQGLEAHYSMRFSDTDRPDGELGEKVRLIFRVVDNLNRGGCIPVFYGDKVSKSELKKRFAAEMPVSIPRAKDGDGVYRVSGRERDLRWGGWEKWMPARMTKGIATWTNIRKVNLPKAGSKAAKERVEEFKRDCAVLRKDLPELERLMKEYRQLSEKSGWGENKCYTWIDNQLSLRCNKDERMKRLYGDTQKIYNLQFTMNKTKMKEQEEKVAADKARANAAYQTATDALRRSIAAEHGKRLAETEKAMEDLIVATARRLGIK